jgi:hypothetical protein
MTFTAASGSAVATGLKNSVIVALLVAVGHVLLKNAVADRQRRRSYPYEHMTPAPMLSQPQSMSMSMSALVPSRASASASASASPAASVPAPGAIEDFEGGADLLAYVYGGGGGASPGNPGVAAIGMTPDPTQQKKPFVVGASDPTSMQPSPPLPPPPCGGVSGKKTQVKTAGDASDACGRFIVGAYQNEDVMCGASLFTGSKLQGYDGSWSTLSSAYAPLEPLAGQA